MVVELFPGAQVSLFGSYAGGLATFSSDLDMTVIFPNRGWEKDTQDTTSNNGTLRATNNGDVGKQLRKNTLMTGNPRIGMVPSPGPIGFDQSQRVLSSSDREELRVQNALMLEALYEELKVFTNELPEISVPTVLIIVLFHNLT